MTSGNDTLLLFVCPQCVASLQALPATAGTRFRCPHCQFVFQAPRESQRRAQGETYALHDGRESSADFAVYISVDCSLCHTRMHGTIQQIGQSLICPDCGRSTVVPRPAIPAKIVAPPIIREMPSQTSDNTYALREYVESTPENRSATDNPLIRVICHRCGTMMYAEEDQVGGQLVCPDCRSTVSIPRPAPPRKPIDVMADAADGYPLAQPVEIGIRPPSPWASPSPSRLNETPSLAEKTLPDNEESPDRDVELHFRAGSERRSLTRFPFLIGTFTFPFAPGTRAYTVLLAIWSATTVWLAFESMRLSNAAGLSIFVGGMFVAAAVLSVTGLFAFASACALAVVRDTADTCETIQTWPGMEFIDWLTEPLLMINAYAASLAPGAAVAWILAQYAEPNRAAMPVSMFILFPLVCLSMLETGSPLGAFSWPVFRSLWQAWWGWIRFYLVAALLLTVAGSVLRAVLPQQSTWAVAVVGASCTTAWLIYFRLLGRLAWYCSDLSRIQDDSEP
jgi:DNA-directed RNA polymerase subunit M/transcription elongation factor TFIIS